MRARETARERERESVRERDRQKGRERDFYKSSTLRGLLLYGVASVSRIDKITGLFCKEPYERDNILQKRHIIFSILLTVATPYLRRSGYN